MVRWYRMGRMAVRRVVCLAAWVVRAQAGEGGKWRVARALRLCPANENFPPRLV